MPGPHQTELSRDLGLFTITMVGVGAMIGAGIFVLTGIAAGTAGPALLVAFAANGVVTFLTALAYAELGSAIPEAGGGYLWVKEGLPGPNAFMAGWMSWFAHAVAGSLYALGFGAYLGLVLDRAGLVPLGSTGAGLEKSLAVVVTLLFVGINFKGVSQTGRVGNIVTIAKLLVIGLFVGSGLWAMFRSPAAWDHFTPFAPEGLGGVLAAMGLTYIAFEGYEIIVQAGEEVKDPKRNIPRAILLSLAIVVPTYLLVAVTALGAVETAGGEPTWMWLGGHQELGLAEAARQFMPMGATFLLVGGLLSTMSALNATTFSSTRVAFAMGRDRNLPDAFARVHRRNRTPHMALAASGALIVFMAVVVPIRDVAAAADVMFLLLFLQVNLAIITIRRKYGDKLDYGFLVPLFPFLPILAIVLMTGIAVFMFRFSPLAWYFVIGWTAVGAIVYRTYARHRERAKRLTPVVLREVVEPMDRHRVLVPVANPRSAEALIDLACLAARAHEGEIVLLHVITVPSQTPLRVGWRYIRRVREEILDPATELVSTRGVPWSSIIRIAHRPAQAILHEVEEREIDMVVMGWRGRPSDPHTVLGSNIDRVFRDADCHVAAFRAEHLKAPRRILIPIANPHQGRLMLRIGGWFAEREGSMVQIVHVIPPGMEERDRRRRLDALRNGLSDVGGGVEARPGSIRVLETHDVVSGLVGLAAEYDLTILGAGREGWFRKITARTVPEQIAKRSSGPLLLVKHRRSPIRSSILDTVEFFRSREPEASA